MGVFNNFVFDMLDFVEFVMFYSGIGFFIMNVVGVVYDDFFIFMCLYYFDCFWQLFMEGICWNFECVFKVFYFIFIVVMYVDKQCIGIVKYGVYFCCLQIFINIVGIKVRIVNIVGNDMIVDFYVQYLEGFFVII